MPYRLSNLLLVTESLTLMAGNSSEALRNISYRRWTPVVVSSVTPKMLLATLTQSSWEDRSVASTTWYSAASVAVASGTAPALANSTPLCTSRVASPPSSRIMFGRWSPQSRMRSVQAQYSSSDSPFQANTGTPLGSSGVPSRPTTMAAAASSWVEKMLQDAHRTSAPSSTSVSIRTAVWMVMCSEPAIRAPRSGRLSR